jgi:hypothetical protein
VLFKKIKEKEKESTTFSFFLIVFTPRMLVGFSWENY